MLEVKMYEAPELLGVLVLFEISPDYCRDTLTIKAQDAALAMGTVLMKNEDGTYGPWAAAAESADPAVAGVLLCEVPASESNVAAPVLRRGAVVSASALKWPADTAEEKKSAALATLEALGVVAR